MRYQISTMYDDLYLYNFLDSNDIRESFLCCCTIQAQALYYDSIEVLPLLCVIVVLFIIVLLIIILIVLY